MKAGKKCATSDAGNVAMTTARTAASPMRTSGQYERGGGSGLMLRLGERDVGIHRSRPDRAIHRNGIDREPIMLIERGEPRDHGIEGRGLELHPDTGSAASCSAQPTSEPGLAAVSVDQDHG